MRGGREKGDSGTHSAYDLARVIDNGNCLLQWHVGQRATGKVSIIVKSTFFGRKRDFDGRNKLENEADNG